MTGGLLGFAIQRNSNGAVQRALLGSLGSHGPLLPAGKQFFVNYVTICQSNVQKKLEKSNVPFFCFAVD